MNAAETTARIKQLLGSGDTAGALLTAEQSVDANPDQENLYLLAVCQRYCKLFNPAFATLERLERLNPAHSRLWQERGHLYLACGDNKQALTAYHQATRLNATLHASWKAIAKLDNEEQKKLARVQLHYLSQLPRELVAVSSQYYEGRLDLAEKHCRHFLQHNKHHPEALRWLALIASQHNIYDEAQFLLESALQIAPDSPMIRYSLVEVLKKRQDFQGAYQQASILYNQSDKPEQHRDPALAILLANQALAIGHYDEAIRLYQQQLDRAPQTETVHLSLGHAWKTSGDQQQALRHYRDAYSHRPTFGDAYWSLANLKTYSFLPDEVTQMQQQLRNPGLLKEDRTHFCFALGKALEDSGNYHESFACYEQGNQLKKSSGSYNSAKISAEFDAQKTVFTKQMIAEKCHLGNPATDPIFIVGLPRAGSTLLEQILSSHSQVDGTLELPNILAIAQRLRRRHKLDTSRPGYPQALAQLSADELRSLGDTYLHDTAIHRKTAPFFTDKMPNNFRHIGLIKLILPNAKIIDARRHPMACCFSVFKQLFAEGQEFSYSLEDVGRYYADYVDLMDFWHECFPGEILSVQYEDVITDTEVQVRRILDYCGLPFEAACLEFHKTERPVRTASSEQVRQPIYTSGIDQWRNYQPYLQPLEKALGSTLQNYRPTPISNQA